MSIKTKIKLLCILSNIIIGIINLLKIIIYLTELYIKTIVTFIIFIAIVWFFYPQTGNDIFKKLQLMSIFHKTNFISVFFMIYIVLTIYIKGRLPIKYLSFRSVINYEGEYMIVEKNKKELVNLLGKTKEIERIKE